MSSQLVFRLIDKLVLVSIEEVTVQSLRSAFDDWFRQLNTNSTRESSFTQIEEDTVLFVETTYLDRNYLVDYLVSGGGGFSAKSIPSHKVVQPLIDFLRGTTNEKPPQVSELDYTRLRQQRELGDRSAYLARLYRISNLYHPAMAIMDRVLTVSLTSPRLAALAHDLPRYQVSETVIERTLFHIKNAIGLLQATPGGQQFPEG